MNFLEKSSRNLGRTSFSLTKGTTLIEKVQLRNVKWISLFIFSLIFSAYAFNMSPFGRFHGKGNLDLIQYLKRTGIVKSDKVFDAMCQVDRGKYTHPNDAYIDSPQGIGYGATISAPHMHGYALEFLTDKLREGGRALDVGSGSGYLTTCMALMLGSNGVAVGIEHVPQLQEIARRNIESDHSELLSTGRIELIVGDGRLGYPQKAPYDAIHVGAAAPEAPKKLIDQLAPGGRMIVPIGMKNGDQTLYQIDKTMDGKIQQTSLMGVVYVPLTDKERQRLIPMSYLALAFYYCIYMSGYFVFASMVLVLLTIFVNVILKSLC